MESTKSEKNHETQNQFSIKLLLILVFFFPKTLNVSIINNSISIIINKDLLFPPQPEENIWPRKSESF